MTRSILLPLLMAGAVLPLVACDADQPGNDAKADARPATLAAGEYEVTAKVVGMRSTDGKVPLIKAKVGDVLTSKGCVDARGAPEPALFAAAGDQCTASNGYFSGGIVNVTLDCARKGVNGRIMVNVDGGTSAGGLGGHATTTTFIDGPGDYELRTAVTGKRIGVCPAKG